MLIIGAGMSGLLAGQFFRSKKPRILEKQDSLPNNHKALLRFRSESVSNLTGIDFRKVRVDKAISVDGNLYNSTNILMDNNYSKKVTGRIGKRSISDLSSVDRYIAPDDFIQKVSNGLIIEYGCDARPAILAAISNGDPIVSTMPVTDLARLLGYELGVELRSIPVHILTAEIEDCDVYQTVYFPSSGTPLYRMSITGNKVIAEFVSEKCCMDLIADTELKRVFGVSGCTEWKYSHQRFGKLVPNNGQEVHKFMGWATQKHNIYSLGRWGIHRQILMDDVVKDLHVINRMMRSGNYER